MCIGSYALSPTIVILGGILLCVAIGWAVGQINPLAGLGAAGLVGMLLFAVLSAKVGASNFPHCAGA